jgi:hypothetical protein
MSARLGIALCAIAAAFALGGCEQRQKMTGNATKGDTPLWQSGESRWPRAEAPAPDKASWERQMAARAQHQNDYSRGAQ